MAWVRSQKSKILNHEFELEDPPVRSTSHLLEDYEPPKQHRAQRSSPFQDEGHDDFRFKEYPRSYDSQNKKHTEDYQETRHSRSPKPELIEREAMEGFIPKRTIQHLLEDYKPPSHGRSPFRDQDIEINSTKQLTKSHGKSVSSNYVQNLAEHNPASSNLSKIQSPDAIEKEVMEGFIPKRTTQHLLEDYKAPSRFRPHKTQREETIKKYEYTKTSSASKETNASVQLPKIENKPQAQVVAHQRKVTPVAPPPKQQTPPAPSSTSEYESESESDSSPPQPPITKVVAQPPQPKQVVQTIPPKLMEQTVTPPKQVPRVVQPKQTLQTIPLKPKEVENKPQVVANQPKVTLASPLKQQTPPESSSSSEYESESDSPSPPPPIRKVVAQPPQPKQVVQTMPPKLMAQTPPKQVQQAVQPKPLWQTIPARPKEVETSAQENVPTTITPRSTANVSAEYIKQQAESKPNAVHSPFNRDSIDEAEEAKRKARFLQGMYFTTISGYHIVPIWSEKSPFKGQNLDGAGAKMGIQTDSENVKILLDVGGFASKNIEVRFKPYFVEIEAKYAPKRRGFVKKFDLPTGTKAQTIQCSLFPTSGVLQILVPPHTEQD